MAAKEIIKQRNLKSDDKKMITDNVWSTMAAEKTKKRSKIEYDEKKMITDSVSSMAAEKSETESGCRSWSDLQTDMVRSILRVLPSLGDRIRARTVCKNWLLPLNEIPPRSSSSELPLVLSIKWDCTIDIQRNLSECKLFDPFNSKKKIGNLKYPTNQEFQDMKFPNAQVCASKNGWVMFYHVSTQGILSPTFRLKTSFFLYNPFTKHTITLPDLISPCLTKIGPSFDIATFSSSPDEDDCVFFLVRRDLYKQSFIATYRRSIMEQQQKWKIDQFKEENGNGMITYDPIKGSVYIDGIFYFVSINGTLMSFNIALHERTNLTTFCPIPNDRNQFSYILKSNGELLLVYELYDLKMLYVFDNSSKVWVRRENRYLKDKTLFLGSYGSFAVTVDGADDDQNEIAKMAYYCYIGDKTRCYSFTNMTDNWEENLRKCGSGISIIWIQPPSKF